MPCYKISDKKSCRDHATYTCFRSFPADDPSRPSENVYSRAFFIALMPVRSIAPDKRVKESEAAMTWRAKNLTSTENSWMVQQKRRTDTRFTFRCLYLSLLFFRAA